MPTPTDDRCEGRPGKEAELKAAQEGLTKPTGEEDGNREPGAKHPAAPHLVHFAGIAGDLLDESGLTITRLQRSPDPAPLYRCGRPAATPGTGRGRRRRQA